LARRSTAAWGATSREAKHASDDTFFYANASLQHANFNQDEWLELEDWVKDLTEDDTNRINSISGPIFGDNPRSITPAGRETALIPAAYFKVVTFVAGGALQVRAFIMAQDAAALQDKQGRRMFDNQRYQVTVTEIEERTGLIFPKEVPDNNPLFFNEDAEKAEQLHISQFPERIEVDTPKEVVAKDTERDFVIDTGDVRIVAAMVNPEGDERRGEWVTILNLSGDRVDLAGWTLSDTLRQPYDLEGQIPPGEALRVTPVTPLMLGNRGGTIALFDNQKRRIDRVRYFANDARPEGVPVSFIDRAEPIAPAV
ncbi:MAG: DNA/RNA non-specific endonuclease, partial [Pseudomonadota bacterium]